MEIHEVTNTRSKTHQEKFRLKVDENIITDEFTLSNIFYEFFINIGAVIQDEIVIDNSCCNELTEIKPNSMFLYTVTTNELIMHINSLKNNSSPGQDKLSENFIEKINAYILKPLIHMFNLSFK